MQTQSTRRRHSFNRSLEKLSPPDRFGTRLAAVGIVQGMQPSAEGVSNRTCPAGSLLPPRSWSSQPCSTNSGKNKVAGDLQKYIHLYIGMYVMFPSLYKINLGFHLQRPYSFPSPAATTVAEAAVHPFIIPPR